MKTEYLTVSIRLLIKGKQSPGYRGCTVKFGELRPLSFSVMALAVMREILRHYAHFCTVDELNVELEKIRDYLNHYSIEANDDR